MTAGRRRRSAALAIAIAAALMAADHPQLTSATWTDAEYATGTIAAGTVSPPTNFACGPAGLLQPVTYHWTAPSGGVTLTGYRWTASGPGGSPAGTLAASATSVTISQGLLGLGSGTFTLYAQGPGNWEATPVTGSYSVLGILGLTAVSSCTVP